MIVFLERATVLPIIDMQKQSQRLASMNVPSTMAAHLLEMDRETNPLDLSRFK